MSNFSVDLVLDVAVHVVIDRHWNLLSQFRRAHNFDLLVLSISAITNNTTLHYNYNNDEFNWDTLSLSANNYCTRLNESQSDSKMAIRKQIHFFCSLKEKVVGRFTV